MEFVAGALLLSTILYLVDKNQKWKFFWRAIWSSVAVAILAVCGLFISDHYAAVKFRQQQAAAKANAPDFIPASTSDAQWTDYKPIETPKTLPSGFVNWDLSEQDKNDLQRIRASLPKGDPRIGEIDILLDPDKWARYKEKKITPPRGFELERPAGNQ